MKTRSGKKVKFSEVKALSQAPGNKKSQQTPRKKEAEVPPQVQPESSSGEEEEETTDFVIDVNPTRQQEEDLNSEGDQEDNDKEKEDEEEDSDEEEEDSDEEEEDSGPETLTEGNATWRDEDQKTGTTNNYSKDKERWDSFYLFSRKLVCIYA